MDIVLFVLVGLVAGWLTGQLLKGSSYGIVGDVVVGVLGSLVGGALFPRLGIVTGGGLLGAVIVATLGAMVLVFALRIVNQIRGGAMRL